MYSKQFLKFLYLNQIAYEIIFIYKLKKKKYIMTVYMIADFTAILLTFYFLPSLLLFFCNYYVLISDIGLNCFVIIYLFLKINPIIRFLKLHIEMRKNYN